MADENSNATAAPAATTLPSWLTNDWEATTTSEVHVCGKVADGPHDVINIQNFTFLGHMFQSSSYVIRTGSETGPVEKTVTEAGVCAELAEKLKAAQRNMYGDYLRELRAKDPTAAGDAAGFTEWCGSTLDVNLAPGDRIRTIHNGWQFRKGNHSTGAATDIDADHNPWVVTKDPAEASGLYGGEPHGLPPQDKALQASRQVVWDAYLHAVQFRFGNQDIDLSYKPGQSSGEAFARVLRVHRAVISYLHLFFWPYPKVQVPKSVTCKLRDLDDTRAKMESYVKYLANLPDSKPYIDQLNRLLSNPAELAQRRNEAIVDHENLRYAMIYNAATKVGTKLAFEMSRDPCRGFCNLRKDVVLRLREQGLRWGAVDFSSLQNGDVMHFDLGQNFKPKTVRTDNTGRFYTKP